MNRSRTIDMSAKLDSLRRRHTECDEQLKSYEKRHYLSTTEEAEVRRLKKLKLAAKDEIARIERGGHA